MPTLVVRARSYNDAYCRMRKRSPGDFLVTVHAILVSCGVLRAPNKLGYSSNLICVSLAR